jgi:ribose transport system substrate-binding protein
MLSADVADAGADIEAAASKLKSTRWPLLRPLGAPQTIGRREPSSREAPHPYFAPWEQAAADVKKDFGIAAVDFKVPSAWKLNLQTELLESLMTQGYNGFGVFPGDAVGINSTIEELASNNAPSIALAGCAQDPTKVAFCFGTDVYNSAYLGTEALIKAMGGKGKIVHLAGLLIDPNTKLRMDAVEKAVKETNGSVTLIQHLTDIDQQEAADQKINALLGAQKDQIDGMVATAYICRSSQRNRFAISATSASS